MKSFVSSVGRSYFVRTRFTLYDRPASQTEHGTLVPLILMYYSYILLYMTSYFQNIHYLISPIFKCMYLFMSFSKLDVQSGSPQQKRHDRFSLNSCQQHLWLIYRALQRVFLYISMSENCKRTYSYNYIFRTTFGKSHLILLLHERI